MHDPVQILVDIGIPETQYAKSLAMQKCIPRRIPFRARLQAVLPAINFDYEAIAKRSEINDKMADRRLPPEVKAQGLELT